MGLVPLIYSVFRILLTRVPKLYETKFHTHATYEAKLGKKAVLKPNTMSPPKRLP
jgi:hypothetical protein